MAAPIIPPHDMEAEAAVIGAVLLDGEWLNFVDLQPEDFYIHRHGFIWSAILAVQANGLDVDQVTVVSELKRRQQYHEIGGESALYEIIHGTPNFNNAESYAEIIRQHAHSRRYLELSSEIAQQALNGGVDVATAIEVLSASSQGDRDGRHISAGLADLAQTVAERMQDPVDIWGIPTGFTDWDKRMGGCHKQQVILLSGESGTGKTTLMLQAALNAACAGYGVAIFEKEMDEQRTLRRLIEIDCGVTNRSMVSGRITPEQWEAFQASQAKLSELPIYINDDPVSTTAEIRGVVARARVRMPIDIVYLDYLGLLGDTPPGNQNDWDQTKAVRFRELCRYMDLAGFAIQDMVKFDGVPNMQSLSGGSKVRFGADWIFIISQDEQNNNLHWLLPAKQRDGDQGNKRIPLLRRGLPFYDTALQDIDLGALNYAR